MSAPAHKGTKAWIKLLADNIISVLGKQKFSTLIEFQALGLPNQTKIEGFMTKTILSGSMG